MYWLLSLPLGEEAPDRVWNRLQELTTYTSDYSVNFKFKLPENIKVGTLDSLLALSDDLIKVNAAVEGTVNKIRRQLFELQSGLPEDEQVEVWVEGMSPEGYLQRFVWNEAKYPSRRPPNDTVAAIMDTVQKLDEDLKVRARGRGYRAKLHGLPGLVIPAWLQREPPLLTSLHTHPSHPPPPPSPPNPPGSHHRVHAGPHLAASHAT